VSEVLRCLMVGECWYSRRTLIFPRLGWIRRLLEVCRDSGLFVLGVVGDVAVVFESSGVNDSEV